MLKIIAMTALLTPVQLSPPHKDSPSMSTMWLEIKMSRHLCAVRGENAVRKAGFTENFEVAANETIFGERDGYTALVRCAANNGFVYLVVAGPSGDEGAAGVTQHLKAIHAKFAEHP